MTSKTNIIGYCRVSTTRQANEGYSVDEQERRIRNYVAAYFDKDSYDLEILREEGKSAKNLDRPQMKVLLSRAKEKSVDVLVFFCLNRLTRSLADTLYLLQVANNNDIQLISISEKLDTTTAMGRYFITTIAALAQLEREQDGERSIRGLVESAKQGNYALPKYPFGYRKPDGHHLVIYEEEATVVREIFNDVANGTHTVYSKALDLKGRGVSGRQWSNSYLYRLLKNKIYYGTLCCYGEEIPNHSPAIISEDIYNKAQKNLDGTRGVTKHEYLFKKYCVCSACKNRLTVTTAQTSAREIHYYKCQCTSLYISEDKILDLVEDTFTNVYWNDLYSKQMDKLKAQYRVSNTSLRRIKSAVSDFGVSEMQLSDLVDKETEKNRTIKKAILTLRKKLEQTSFRTLSYEKQRDFLRNHVECIVVYLKMVDVKIKWKK